MAGNGVGAGAFADSFLRTYGMLKGIQQQDAQQKWMDMQRNREMAQWQQEDEINSAMRQGSEAARNKGGLQVTPEFMKQAMPNIDDGAAKELSERVRGLHPQQAAEVVKQYQQFYGMRGPRAGEAAQTSPVTEPGRQVAKEQQPGAVAAQQPQVDPQSFRAYRGDDGQLYMTAGPEHQPKPSEIMMEQARRLMSGAGGARGAQQGIELQKQAADLMKIEHEQEFTEVMNRPNFQERVNGLLGMLNGSATVAGTAELQQGPNGEVQLVHSVPGKEKPHVTTIKGGSPDEILMNLAMRVRERTNPDLYFKRMELERAQQNDVFNRGMKEKEYALDKDYKMGNLDLEREYRMGALDIDRAQLAQRQAEFNKEYGLRAADLSDRRQARAFDQAIAKERINQERWKPYGIDGEGNPVFYDERSDKFRTVTNPKGVTPFSKVSGEKADTDAKKQYRQYIREGGMDDPPARRMEVARSLGVDPAEFGLGTPETKAVESTAERMLGEKAASRSAPPPPSKTIAVDTNPRGLKPKYETKPNPAYAAWEREYGLKFSEEKRKRKENKAQADMRTTRALANARSKF